MGLSARASAGVLQLMEDNNSLALSLWRWPNPVWPLMVTFTFLPFSHKPRAFKATILKVVKVERKMVRSCLFGSENTTELQKMWGGCARDNPFTRRWALFSTSACNLMWTINFIFHYYGQNHNFIQCNQYIWILLHMRDASCGHICPRSNLRGLGAEKESL